MFERRFVTVIAVNAKPDAVLLMAARWGISGSDPLLSEFTRLTISDRKASAWVNDGGDGVVTLVSSALAGTGLVEIAAESPARYPSVWAELRPEVVTVSRQMGFSRLEIIDRHSSLATQGGRVLDGVRRMKSTQIRTSPTGLTSPYEESDFNEVAAIIRTVFEGHPENGNWTPGDVRRRLAQPWFDAEGLRLQRDGSRLVGFCWCKVHPDGVGEIYLLAVRPEYAGEGHGKVLANAGIGYLSDAGSSDLIVYTAVDNETALHLYSSVGFVTDRIERRLEILLR